jgi:hypothetical protein
MAISDFLQVQVQKVTEERDSALREVAHLKNRLSILIEHQDLQILKFGVNISLTTSLELDDSACCLLFCQSAHGQIDLSFGCRSCRRILSGLRCVRIS